MDGVIVRCNRCYEYHNCIKITADIVNLKVFDINGVLSVNKDYNNSIIELRCNDDTLCKLNINCDINNIKNDDVLYIKKDLKLNNIMKLYSQILKDIYMHNGLYISKDVLVAYSPPIKLDNDVITIYRNIIDSSGKKIKFIEAKLNNIQQKYISIYNLCNNCKTMLIKRG